MKNTLYIPQWFEVIKIIGSENECSASIILKKTSFSVAYVGYVCPQLEEQGLIKRTKGTINQRTLTLSLTTKGKDYYNMIRYIKKDKWGRKK